jgi:hypothetical protein
MIIANVSHKFANANHEKIRVKILYCIHPSSVAHLRAQMHPTYEGLDMKEEHTNGIVPGLIQFEEVHSSVLWRKIKSCRIMGVK